MKNFYRHKHRQRTVHRVIMCIKLYFACPTPKTVYQTGDLPLSMRLIIIHTLYIESNMFILFFIVSVPHFSFLRVVVVVSAFSDIRIYLPKVLHIWSFCFCLNFIKMWLSAHSSLFAFQKKKKYRKKKKKSRKYVCRSTFRWTIKEDSHTHTVRECITLKELLMCRIQLCM